MLILMAVMAAIFSLLVLGISRRRPVSASAGTKISYARPPVPGGKSFRVGCYNIHRGKGLDGRRDLGRIASTIDDADILGLCEVAGPFYGIAPSQSQRLGRALGMGWLFSPTQTRWLRHDRGNGLLSRFEVKRWYHEPLVDSTGRRGRVLTTAETRIAGETVTVMVTHLSRRHDQEIQLRTIFARFLQYERAILLGDFNVSRSFTVLREFLESGGGDDAIGQALGDDDEPTRIDWILTRGLTVLRGGWADLGPSDHPYYWVDLAIARSAVSMVTAPSAKARAGVRALPLAARESLGIGKGRALGVPVN